MVVFAVYCDLDCEVFVDWEWGVVWFLVSSNHLLIDSVAGGTQNENDL